MFRSSVNCAGSSTLNNREAAVLSVFFCILKATEVVAQGKSVHLFQGAAKQEVQGELLGKWEAHFPSAT